MVYSKIMANLCIFIEEAFHNFKCDDENLLNKLAKKQRPLHKTAAIGLNQSENLHEILAKLSSRVDLKITIKYLNSIRSEVCPL